MKITSEQQRTQVTNNTVQFETIAVGIQNI